MSGHLPNIDITVKRNLLTEIDHTSCSISIIKQTTVANRLGSYLSFIELCHM